MPFDFPATWPEAAKKPFDAFRAARQAMQKQMEASIAAHADSEILVDQPAVSKNKLRITGPFTVEAVPFATVFGLDEAEQPKQADVAVARSGATARQSQWRDELLKAGIRGKGGQKIQLIDLTPLPGAKYIHAVGTVAEGGDKLDIPSLWHQDPLRKQILFALNMDTVVGHVSRFVSAQNTEKFEAIFDETHPIGSTARMRPWLTTRPCPAGH